MAGHVSAWEGEEIERTFIKIHPQQLTKEIELVIKVYKGLNKKI